MILAGLARNAAQPEGADPLHGAVQRDHDGSLLDDLGGFLGGGRLDSPREECRSTSAGLDRVRVVPIEPGQGGRPPWARFVPFVSL